MRLAQPFLWGRVPATVRRAHSPAPWCLWPERAERALWHPPSSAHARRCGFFSPCARGRQRGCPRKRRSSISAADQRAGCRAGLGPALFCWRPPLAAPSLPSAGCHGLSADAARRPMGLELISACFSCWGVSLRAGRPHLRGRQAGPGGQSGAQRQRSATSERARRGRPGAPAHSSPAECPSRMERSSSGASLGRPPVRFIF